MAAGALGVSFLVGVAWELFRKRRQNSTKGKSVIVSDKLIRKYYSFRLTAELFFFFFFFERPSQDALFKNR